MFDPFFKAAPYIAANPVHASHGVASVLIQGSPEVSCQWTKESSGGGTPIGIGWKAARGDAPREVARTQRLGKLAGPEVFLGPMRPETYRFGVVALCDIFFAVRFMKFSGF